MSALVFEPVERSRRQLVMRYRFGDINFSTSYWYDTVDFHELAERYGAAFMRSVEFHLLAFEANKAASLAPATIDFGPYADLATDAFWGLWETIFHNVWGVWRYENDLPDYRLRRPAGPGEIPVAVPDAVAVAPGEVATLMLCGGGKDSLASMTLLEAAGIEYDAFVYSHSTYGRGGHQHDLIDDLLAHCGHRRLRRGWVFDDAIDSPAAHLEDAEERPAGGIERMVAAETVSSYWTALPLALQHGYTGVALGITRSTDEHNLTWERTGEDINYLWGMSSRAEDLLHDYVRDHLVSNVDMFHILRPVHDVNVFTLLNRRLDAVPATHSCAQLKPWCCRCAKCVYVWMNYVAWLPEAVVAETFRRSGGAGSGEPGRYGGVNLFELPENRTTLRKTLGLESYKPTDCVGTVGEARLAFLMCRHKGVGGVIADDIDQTDFVAEAPHTLDRYAAAARPGRVFPVDLAAAITPQLAASEADAQRIARTVLGEIVV